MDFKLNKRKKTLRQLVVALLLLCTIGLPMQNIVLANEPVSNEGVIVEVPEKAATKEGEEIGVSEEEEQSSEGAVQEKKDVADTEDTDAAVETATPEQQIAESINSNSKSETTKSTETENKKRVGTKITFPDAISNIFPDVVLAENIRTKLGKNSVDEMVTQADLDVVDYIAFGKNAGLKDLSGVEYLSNLKHIIAYEGNEISDLSPIANSSKLEILRVPGNQISDISVLRNLSKLRDINLSSNLISDISALDNLQVVDELYLNNNQISDLSPISNLKITTAWKTAADQKIEFPERTWAKDMSFSLPLRRNGEWLEPKWDIFLNNQVSFSYTAPTLVIQDGISNENQEWSLSFYENVQLATNSYIQFSGQIYFPIKAATYYDANFDIDGAITTVSVLENELLAEPKEPNKTGYAFTGWYDAESGGNKWDFSTDKMPAKEMTLYARFNKLGFVTPEIKPSVPTVVTPITPGVDPITPSEPPTTPDNRPNPVTPSTPGTSGNQTPSNGSGVNTGNMTITSQGNNIIPSPTTSQKRKLAKLGESNSLFLQGFGLLLVLSGVAFFLWKRRKVHS
ncbi:InlB B-repeat-containing protein [Listeria monocytogenes]|uniref:InlB B-repeat-containing protein n=1 Tax=Listeria monocytogenes TaxID=1639 RepID=UPI0010F336CB|nr:InlB B-repeat-containing protein [Listeria monocytogenes]EAC8464488.1 LPXTG cell wall anchor domain-containing protein [Listeria monocytogenes]